MIPEDDLHAYVDGQLPPGRHAAVAHQLHEQPENAGTRCRVCGAA